ncbi:MAG: DUF1206 domain-containing protein [Pseudomonadota bacterium]|uniref:DUF1206 domain-containing protein n=1 Tax=Brevundimonas aurantiaca TaxID=74316 RepID=UPI001D18BC84|nr:DUF1206 domain-containing protein [Brevundimonas aurantiaca]MCC4294387.1 DUF1206 domain-containing protein [Brevundimonas aurantiaca]MEC8456785.1 DUF1206 domain-containing protein [Pseudomonadota bacterium]
MAVARLRHAAAALGRTVRDRLAAARRTPPLHVLIEQAARIGYGARGFVYLSAGALTLLAALDRIGDAVGTGGAAGWLAEQPFGRVWLVALGLGLWAFVGWRVLQAVFDADHAGTDAKGWATRAGQAASGLFYGLLAAGVFEYLDEAGGATSQAADQAESIAENQEKAAMVLDLPFGDLLLMSAGLVVLGVGIGNIVRAFRDDFDAALACPDGLRRPASILARIGYGARGFAYLPLGVFVVLAGLHTRSGEVTNTAAALETLESQPGGSWILGLTAVGLMAFGAFAFVEARWRRIRPPRDLKLG